MLIDPGEARRGVGAGDSRPPSFAHGSKPDEVGEVGEFLGNEIDKLLMELRPVEASIAFLHHQISRLAVAEEETNTRVRDLEETA
jgi:hypothetical protein